MPSQLTEPCQEISTLGAGTREGFMFGRTAEIWGCDLWTLVHQRDRSSLANPSRNIKLMSLMSTTTSSCPSLHHQGGAIIS
jgi:hypothetical protein